MPAISISNRRRVLQRAMIARALTQRQVAERLGTGQAAISHELAGRRPIDLGRLAQYADAICGDDAGACARAVLEQRDRSNLKGLLLGMLRHAAVNGAAHDY